MVGERLARCAARRGRATGCRPAAEVTAGVTGARYLLEQKLRLDITKSVRTWARSIEQQVLGELRELIRRAHTLRALSGEVSGRTDEVMFHQALLVPTQRGEELAAKVAQLSSELSVQGLSLELTGPWPLYSFVPELAPAAEAGAETSHD